MNIHVFKRLRSLNSLLQAMVVKLKDVGCQLGGDTWSREV